MANREPFVEQSIATNGVMAVTPWTEAREQLEQAGKYWLPTVKPNGQPHVMSLLGSGQNVRIGVAYPRQRGAENTIIFQLLMLLCATTLLLCAT